MSFVEETRLYLKKAMHQTPVGPPLIDWYRRARAVKRLSEWTANDQAAATFYSHFIKPGDLCFDVGANRGLRTKVLSHLGGRVIAIEPQKGCADILRRAYPSQREVIVVQAACGAARGMGTLRVCDTDVLSSLSDEWINAVSNSGRFGQSEWRKSEACEIVTLDELIEFYGTPAFVKVDVEGYETAVLSGLTQPVPSLSFEFTPERMETTLQCVDRLVELGMCEFNLSWSETFELALPSWVNRDQIADLLSQYRENTTVFGDIYVRTRQNLIPEEHRSAQA